MFRCVPYTNSMREEWDKLALSRGTVFHTLAFKQILLDSFGYHANYYAVLDREERICALIPLISGRNLSWQRAGVALPFVNYMDICAENEEAKQYAFACLPVIKKTNQLAYIELRLKEQDIDKPGWRRHLQHYTFVLPLDDEEEKILALSTSSNRNHIRKAYKNGWFTASFDISHLDAFYRVYVKRMKQLGSPAPDIAFFKHFFRHLPDYTALLTVHDQATGQVVGGMLLVVSPGNKTLYYPYGANLIEYNNKYLNNFMYWEAVKFGIRQGMRYLDLGRSQAGSGTYRYKEQWGAKAEQLKYVVYDEGSGHAGPPDKNKLRVFIELWKAMPAFITNEAGKHLIRYLMP